MACFEQRPSPRAPLLRKRTRHTGLRVVELERRELLSSSPLLGPLQGPLAYDPRAAHAATFAPPATNTNSAAQQLANNPPAQGWQDVPQLPALLGPVQKAPANSKGPLARVPLLVGPNQSPSPDGEGYTPAQLRQAYGFNQIALPAGQTFDDAGSGQTIAIIDAMDDPYITSDLQTFDQTFHIGGAVHDPTSTSFFKVVNESGGSVLPATDQGQWGFGMETSLDVEWAHAMAPGASILLVEADSAATADLVTAVESAARQPGVSIISMSFGFGNAPTEYYLDNVFRTPIGHAGVSFVASAGDSGGFFAEYAAMSPNVLGVGGTTLPAGAAGNPDRTQESTWSEGGGGISSTEAEPTYQLGVQSTGWRTGPDLAYNSDPKTGVAVYNTLYANTFFPGKPWFEIGGTSAAAPQMSSLLAIVNQLRQAAKEAPLDGPNQLLPAIYQIAATDPNAFHDITTGTNGYPAGPGYDFATGLGTPNAKYLVPDLVAAYATPTTPRTLYWTGDVNTDWDTPGNWSTVDPAVKNVQQFVVPTAADGVVVDLKGTTILHDTTHYDAISSFTVTAPNVMLDLGAGTIDLAGRGRGTFQADRNGDIVTMEAGILANADVTTGTTLSATSDLTYGDYPELDNVQLDGTLNANKSGADNGLYVSNNLILNGTINLGGTADLSSVLFAGFWDGYVGSQDNNPETISGSGTIRLGKSQDGDALYNWGPLATFTIGSHITVLGGGSGSLGFFEQTTQTGSLDNQGTIQANGGTLVLEAFDPALFGGPTTGAGWTNEGTITASGGATLGLLGGWSNSGHISVDSHSTVLFGNPTTGQLAGDPGAADYGWSSSGSVTLADGATVYVGGFLSTDQYQGTAAIPGVTAHLAADSLFLDGTLDNSPADNPVSHGVLSASSAPLRMVGGTISGGTIKAGSKVQVGVATPLPSDLDDFQIQGAFTAFVAAGGWLDNVTNGGTLTASATILTLSNVTNSGTVSGSAASVIEFLNTWANTGTIKIDGTTSLYLGTPASSDPNFPPTLADGSPYAWDPAAVGSIQVADGATVGFGGLMTTDLLMALPSLPGVSIHRAHDTVLLDGWLDNQPADNPVTGGVLALTSATGPLNLYGGVISGGTITTTGTAALNAIFLFNNGPFYDFASVLDSVTNDGTIAMLSDFLDLEGNVVNNGTLTDSENFLLSGPESSFTNNGSVILSQAAADLQSPVINNGTITVTSGEFGDTATLANSGTISVSSFASFFVGGSMVNSGTVSISTQSSAGFHGNYDNSHGTITVDSTSGLLLGRSTLDQSNFPTIADGSPYAFDAGKVGTIQIADGAKFSLGGLLTTDQWNAFPSLPGVTVNPSKDQMGLAGWLDNSPADNPTSGGVLALTAATGPLFLNGGYIYHGKITTVGPDDLAVGSVGVLDSVEVDGDLNVTGTGGFGEIYVENNLTLNGTIEMPGFLGEVLVGFFDNAADTISGTGTISMGTAQSFESVVVNLSNNSLTFGPGITINAAARSAFLVSEKTQINVEGAVQDDTATSTLYTYGVDHNTFATFQDLANLNGGTLTGGTWEFGNGATWRTDGIDITTNAAKLSISGTGTRVLDSIGGQGQDALAGLTTNSSTGHLTVGPGYTFAPQGTFTNDGIMELGGTMSVQGDYTQSADAAVNIDIASSSVYGTLAVSGTATLAGTLNVALANGFTPAPGASFTILTFGSRSGDFSSENGLNFSPSEHFVAEYVGNTLTLVVVAGAAPVAAPELLVTGGLPSNDQAQVSPAGSSNILSDGTVLSSQSGASLSQALDDWMANGALVGPHNRTEADAPVAGSGLDWFWAVYADDMMNHNPTDLLN